MLDDDKAQLEMDLIMNEQVDPVSGNTAPIGAKPEEVRDDIEIRVSPGEYVINAQTVRYFGEDFFDELQKAAAEGFERIKEGEELPFRDDELATEEDETEEVEPEGFAYGGRVKGYAEGDLVVPQAVGGGYGQYGGTGSTFMGYQSKTFINDETGQKIIIFFFNGRPLSRIPAGFREMGETPAEEQVEAATQTRDDDDDPAPKKESDPTWRNTPVEDWTTDMYKSYADYHQLKENAGDLSILEKSVIGLIGGAVAGPVGSIALTELARRQNKKIAEDVVSNVMGMVDQNRNPDGSPLDVGTLGVLNRARVNANYNIMNLENKNLIGLDRKDSGSIASGSKEAEEILAQQNKIAEKVKLLDPQKESSFYEENYGGAPGAFYGGSEEAETAYILGIDYDPNKKDNDGGYRGPDGEKYDSFHDYVVSNPPAGSTGSGVGYTTGTTRKWNPSKGKYETVAAPDDGKTYITFTDDDDDDEDFDIDDYTDDTTLRTNISNQGNAGSDKDDSDKDNDKILCDLIYRYGYLDEDIWRLDEAFGDRVALEDPELLEGYHIWAKPMVAWIEKESFLAKLYLRYWCVPFTRRWANHIAHIMEPENYKPDYVGKLMLAIGVPISRAIYKLKGRKLKTV